MSRFVIVAYRPKPAMDEALMAAVSKHISVLKTGGFVTDRAAYVMKAKDGTILEVFEWKSAEAISQAHSHPAVQALWGEFGAACDYVPLNTVPESQNMFAEFDAVSLS